MKEQAPIKLIPRNVAALRRGLSAPKVASMIVGNPVSTRLESGVGNCFPGLECDLRNLERRFFPFLEIDIRNDEDPVTVRIVSVDTSGVQNALKSGELAADRVAVYRELGRGVKAGQIWNITEIQGDFGPLGNRAFKVAERHSSSAGPRRLPLDPWTAIRLLTEGSEVRLTIETTDNKRSVSLVGNRARYLDDNGALAAMFLPGELTQSLCSPWTHDFRDCACFYWASNHPDIVLPPASSAEANSPKLNTFVVWERKDRSPDKLPKPATVVDSPVIMSHYEINDKWQTLNFVLESREITNQYKPGTFKALKLADKNELLAHLRYAAGVELAVIHEYLAAAYSFKTTKIPASVRNDVRAARAEVMRITYGEMRHVRVVNDVIRALDPAGYKPALRVAKQVPDKEPGKYRPVVAASATRQTIQAFIDIERPSDGVDGLYARILVTLEDFGTDEMLQAIRSVIADGETHFETYSFVQEWLDRHSETDYLFNPKAKGAPPENPKHQRLQNEYVKLLKKLYRGYTLGIPAGASDINSARNAMIGVSGLDRAAEDLARDEFLVAFDPLKDPRFKPVDHP
jgi:hypothetical protein